MVGTLAEDRIAKRFGGIDHSPEGAERVSALTRQRCGSLVARRARSSEPTHYVGLRGQVPTMVKVTGVAVPLLAVTLAVPGTTLVASVTCV